MFIARDPIPRRRRSEERKVSSRVTVQLSSAPPNGALFCHVPFYKHLAPSE